MKKNHPLSQGAVAAQALADLTLCLLIDLGGHPGRVRRDDPRTTAFDG